MSEHKLPVFVRIGADDGKVLLLFSKDVDGISPANIAQWRIDPRECQDIVEAMATAAFEADTTLKPVGDVAKASIVEQHRMKLTQRVAHMLNTLRADVQKSNGQVAQDIVDVCLKEIF